MCRRGVNKARGEFLVGREKMYCKLNFDSAHILQTRPDCSRYILYTRTLRVGFTEHFTMMLPEGPVTGGSKLGLNELLKTIPNC